MATLDQLPADRRAIIELVLRRGRSYEELSELLAMPEARVREHAREALASLAPRSADRVDPHWRDQIADYVLGQQPGPQANATRAHLRGSEAARTWALSVLDSVGHLLPPGREPRIPGGDGRSAERAAGPTGAPTRRERAAPESAGRRRLTQRGRRGVAVAVAAVIVGGLLVLGIQVLGDDDEEGATATDAAGNGEPQVLAQAALRPVGGARGAGAALVADQAGQPVLLVQARVPRIRRDQAYVIWLYNNPRDAVPVAVPQVDRQGGLQALTPLPRDFERYRFIDVSLQERSDRTDHSGNSVLRARLDQGAPQGP